MGLSSVSQRNSMTPSISFLRSQTRNFLSKSFLKRRNQSSRATPTIKTPQQMVVLPWLPLIRAPKHLRLKRRKIPTRFISWTSMPKRIKAQKYFTKRLFITNWAKVIWKPGKSSTLWKDRKSSQGNRFLRIAKYLSRNLRRFSQRKIAKNYLEFSKLRRINSPSKMKHNYMMLSTIFSSS